MTSSATKATKGRVDFLNPKGLPQSPAFTNVVVVSGPVRTIYIGGQNAISADGKLVGKGDLGAQTEQILLNIKTALAAAGAGPEHVIKWTVFMVEGHSFEEGYAAFQRVWGNQPNPPLITGAVVRGLGVPDALAEMEAIAVVPD
jgi:enamine deaminase RidA (YjgF/YER057c/UK114 family)